MSGLGCLDSPTMLSVDQVATCLGLSPWTLREWRQKEIGPPSHKVGRSVRYYPAEVDAWVLAQT